MAHQKVIIDVPKSLGPNEREQFAEMALDVIIERAQSGKGVRPDKKGNFRQFSFPGYTKEYASKKGQSNVDLELSGDMLEEMQLLSHRSGKVTLGFIAGSEDNDKVEGNQIGSYGRVANPKKARPFLGLTGSELRDLLREFK